MLQSYLLLLLVTCNVTFSHSFNNLTSNKVKCNSSISYLLLLFQFIMNIEDIRSLELLQTREQCHQIVFAPNTKSELVHSYSSIELTFKKLPWGNFHLLLNMNDPLNRLWIRSLQFRCQKQQSFSCYHKVQTETSMKQWHCEPIPGEWIHLSAICHWSGNLSTYTGWWC